VHSEAKGEYGTWLKEYDARNRLTKLIYPESTGFESKKYNKKGQLIESRDRRGNLTTYTYNPNGDVETVTNAAGNVTTYSYDASGNRTAVIDPRDNTTYYHFDGLNRLIQVVEPEPEDQNHTIEYEYNDNSNQTLIKEKIADQKEYKIHKTYTPQNRLWKVWENTTPPTTREYDPSGNLTRVVDQMNRTEEYTYDAINRRETFSRNQVLIEEYDYDENGNMRLMTAYPTPSTPQEPT